MASKNVYDFRSATWNTGGARWTEVAALMNNNNISLDVLAVPEAGTTTGISRQLSRIPNMVQVKILGIDTYLVDFDTGVEEYKWNNDFVYYYRAGPGQGSAKQNIAIISKKRADEVILIPPEVTHESTNAASEAYEARTFINRPALGIRIENSVFFSIHAEPNKKNEAPKLLEVIQTYMAQNYTARTWMAMGDFNTIPGKLVLPIAGNGRFVKIIHSQKPTRFQPGNIPSELDYCVVGGEDQHKTRVTAIQARVLMTQMGSDHKPVLFQ